MVLLGGRAGKT